MAMPPNFGRPGAGPSFLGGGASNANSLQSRLSGGAPSMPSQRPSIPPPTGANGIASAFQGVNPARAGYDVGNAAIMAQQKQSITPEPQEAKNAARMARAQEYGQRGAQIQSAVAAQDFYKNNPSQPFIQNDYASMGFSPADAAARSAFDQQQYQRGLDFQKAMVNTKSPNELVNIMNNYSNALGNADQQFMQQNPGFAQQVQARMNAAIGQPLQGQMQQQGQMGQLGQAQNNLSQQYQDFMRQGQAVLQNQDPTGQLAAQLNAQAAQAAQLQQQAMFGAQPMPTNLNQLGSASPLQSYANTLQQVPTQYPVGELGGTSSLNYAGALQKAPQQQNGMLPQTGGMGFAQPMPQQQNGQMPQGMNAGMGGTFGKLGGF